MSLLQGPARLTLRLLGWKLLELPQCPPRAVVVAYPHTSNWDFPLALLGLAALALRGRWVGKDTLFRGLLGPVMRALGGIAVNRRESTGFVERIAARLQGSERIHLLIAPEGTRGLAHGWKSGFYRIAMAAQVPVVLAVMDYPRRELGLLASTELSGDIDADMAHIATLYAGRRGHRAEQASPITLL